MSESPAEFFDTHVHLCDASFEADREAVVERARAAGVAGLLEIADSEEDWGRTLAWAQSRSGRCALGLHPYYAERCTGPLLARLETLAGRPEVAAIGEIGLDYARSPAAPEFQQQALRRLLAACRRWDKPAVIHCRQAYPDLRGIIDELYREPPRQRRFWGVVHCFSGSPEEAEALVRAGFALGADGPVTYPTNEALREAFRRAGAAATVLETDSPYLPPQSRRGRRNEPDSLPEIAAALSRVWGVPVAQVAAVTTQNARDLFQLG